MVRDRAERPKERSRRRTKGEGGRRYSASFAMGGRQRSIRGPAVENRGHPGVLRLSSWSFLAPKLFINVYIYPPTI